MANHKNVNIPNGISQNALVGYIHTATCCTTDLDTYKHFYGEVMMMEVEGPFELSEEEKLNQKVRWNIPSEVDYDLYHIYRKAVPSLIHLRILHLKKATPQIHNSYSSYELGSFSLGFPTSNAKKMHERMEHFKVEAMAPMQLGDIVRADGKAGQYLETIYKGPDYLHCVGIERVNYEQLAPCDPATGFGGPGYSAFVAKDSDAEVAFYTDVLGHFVLFDSIWETAEGSALGTGPKVPFRFTGIYAQGAKQNHFLLLDFKDGNMIDTGVQSCPPNQGLGMYTFCTTSIGEVYQKAVDHGIKVLSSIREIEDPILGMGRGCLLETPNGFYIEIFEES